MLVHFVKAQKPIGLKEVADYQNMFGGFGDAVYKYVMDLERAVSNLFREFRV